MKPQISLIAVLLLVSTISIRGAWAFDPPAARPETQSVAASPNSALIYWQAFAALPNLPDESRQTFDAAVKSTTGPLPDGLPPIVRQFETSLDALHRARRVRVCDWQLDLDAGPMLQLPHLQKARELARAALLRARLRFLAGETDLAVDDVLAVLKLGRDCASGSILIAMLVDVAIEKLAIDVLASNLTALQPIQLDRLAESLKQLPPTPTVAECVRAEGRFFSDWLQRSLEAEAAKINNPRAGGKVLRSVQEQIQGPAEKLNGPVSDSEARRELIDSLTVEEVRQSVQRLRVDYEEMSRISALRYSEQPKRWAEYDAKLAASRTSAQRDDVLRLFSTLFLPTSKISLREEQFLIRRHLLELAVQVQRHGPEAVKTAKPFGQGTVEFRKTTTGFELDARCTSNNELERLQVGASK